MTTRARAFRATHAPGEELKPVLPEFHRFVDVGGTRDVAAVEGLAKTVHLPVAAVRGALSSYSEVGTDHRAIRVCAGTSCMLARGGDIARALGKERKCTPVYCLGYCDRSPVAMTAGSKVVVRVGPGQFDTLKNDDNSCPHPPPPSVRCDARHAVVTERIGQKAWRGEAMPSYDGLAAALKMEPAQVIDTVLASGVRGRGGAAYPTGNKWKLAAKAAGSPKFIVANGDEGDPGSFIDRELMERDPHAILEGMAICAHAIGASRGIVFIRSEYPVAAAVISRAIDAATKAGLLAEAGDGRGFSVEVVRGLGSYVCGEETALLAAIEGQRGEVWPRPPYPVEAGLFGKPTVVDNVETLANIPWIMQKGSAAYGAMGSADSKGTKALCLNHGFAMPGIVEVEFGVTLRDVIDRLGGGAAGGGELEAVLLGGPMGSIVTPDQWDAPICFAGMARRGINLGHGGLVAIPRPADWGAILRHLIRFMKDESCGKCVPCRLGTARAHDIVRDGLTRTNLSDMNRILGLMKEASLCAFGRETPGPVGTILEKFGDRVFEGARS